MEIKKNIMKDYEQKVYELRREIVNAIIDLLKEHDLKELKLLNAPEDFCYVIWFDNAGNIYDSPVKKVSFDKDGICLYVEDEETGFTAVLYGYDFACQNLDWLCIIYENIFDTLKLSTF